MHFFTSQQCRHFPASYNFLLIMKKSQCREKSSPHEPNIVDDLITSCPHISRVLSFFHIFPLAHCYIMDFLACSRNLPYPTLLSDPSTIIKETFGVQIGGKITASSCLNAYHCHRQHFCVAIQATSSSVSTSNHL